MHLTTTTILIHPTGGITTIPAVAYTSDEAAIIQLHLNNIPATPITTAIQELITSQQMPKNASTITQDIPTTYLGYNRNGPTKLWVRLKEAWLVVMGKPSQAYFTDENGDYAEGQWKDAFRLTISESLIKNGASVAYLSAYTFVIPIIPCIKYQHLPSDPEACSLLLPFMMEIV
jgi:hypothetical protein